MALIPALTGAVVIGLTTRDVLTTTFSLGSVVGSVNRVLSGGRRARLWGQSSACAGPHLFPTRGPSLASRSRGGSGRLTVTGSSTGGVRPRPRAPARRVPLHAQGAGRDGIRRRR